MILTQTVHHAHGCKNGQAGDFLLPRQRNEMKRKRSVKFDIKRAAHKLAGSDDTNVREGMEHMQEELKKRQVRPFTCPTAYCHCH